MHGLVCSKFQEFYISNFGLSEWDKFAKKAGIDTHFELTKSYSDKMFMRILVMALEVNKLNARETLESFGKFLTPFLLKLYQPKDEWRTLDLLEKTESEIHTTIRMRDQNAAPPRLQIKRWDQNEVEIRYNSHRNIPSLGIGIIKGLAEHFNELDSIEIKARRLKAKSYSIRVLKLDETSLNGSSTTA